MEHIATAEEQLAGPIVESAETDLAVRSRIGISRLLAHRDDLRGVHAFADLLEESVRWSA